MAQDKYLVTVDKDTGATIKIEQVGPDGELSEVTPGRPGTTTTNPGQAVAARPGPQTVVINITMGGATPGVVTTGGPTAPQAAIPIGHFGPDQQGIPIGHFGPDQQQGIPIGHFGPEQQQAIPIGHFGPQQGIPIGHVGPDQQQHGIPIGHFGPEQQKGIPIGHFGPDQQGIPIGHFGPDQQTDAETDDNKEEP
jgi:hypothetical protein